MVPLDERPSSTFVQNTIYRVYIKDGIYEIWRSKLRLLGRDQQ
jgi:hypothetical protein